MFGLFRLLHDDGIESLFPIQWGSHEERTLRDTCYTVLCFIEIG
jgi:hypothetical protein